MTPVKRLVDVAVAAPLSVAILPVVGAVALLNRMSGDSGPVLFRGTRVGEGGRTFRVFKLRTMTDGAGGPLTVRGDPRVTRVGRILRATKIDELPQLWNVVRGEMSLVGPRPEDPAFVDWSDPVHRVVFRARPGITGLAQLAFADEEHLHTGDEHASRYRSEILPSKLELDLAYLRSWSLRLDLRILAETAALVVRRVGRSRR